MLEILDKVCTPIKGTKYSACIDLKSRIDTTIGAGETKVILLGVRINHEKLEDISDSLFLSLHDFKRGYYLQLMLRSSLGEKSLIIPNGVGIIDMDYKGEIKIIIHNPLNELYTINRGDKIAQIAILKHQSYLFNIDSNIERKGGFGSTGK